MAKPYEAVAAADTESTYPLPVPPTPTLSIMGLLKGTEGGADSTLGINYSENPPFLKP